MTLLFFLCFVSTRLKLNTYFIHFTESTTSLRWSWIDVSVDVHSLNIFIKNSHRDWYFLSRCYFMHLQRSFSVHCNSTAKVVWNAINRIKWVITRRTKAREKITITLSRCPVCISYSCFCLHRNANPRFIMHRMISRELYFLLQTCSLHSHYIIIIPCIYFAIFTNLFLFERANSKLIPSLTPLSLSSCFGFNLCVIFEAKQRHRRRE